MPRTMLVLPTSTTSRLDGIADRLRQDQIARADGDRSLAVAQHRAAVLVDSGPCAADGALADDAADAVAHGVHGQVAPLVEHALPVEGPRQTGIDVLDERFGREADAAKIARRDFGD